MDRPLENIDVDTALRTIIEGTATETGSAFFKALVRNLATTLNTHGAWVTEYFAERRVLRPFAFWLGEGWVDMGDMPVEGTACERVVEERRLVHIPDNLIDVYGNDPDVRALGAASYMGVPLLDLDDTVLGHLAVLDLRPMPAEPRMQTLFQIFAGRAAAELRRLRAEAQVREREKKLSRLVGSAMDAIIELDRHLSVTQLNPAAEKVFGCRAADMTGRAFNHYLVPDGREKLARLIVEIDTRPEGQRSLWIAGGLNAASVDGKPFQAEATLSRFDADREPFYTLILRNVNERIEAEQKIRSLTVETEYLREEIKSLTGADDIVGQSAPWRKVLQEVKEVAGTDATVLILGETGTGKEVIARAIHRASRRQNKPLVKVNCAAIPATLIESEFFGHEAGAFTGATKKRDGRFALANGGTIFLDEVGEIPLDLQGKLLRVLQEGEFEPVGSSLTRKVDVRILAATNRDLAGAVAAGQFREDLFYRLNVYPIRMPALRERRDDIGLLASAFATKFAKTMGRTIEPLSRDSIERLESYHWPGNVRELQNIIERAAITARDGKLNLDRALPEPAAANTASSKNPDASISSQRILSSKDIAALERRNLIAALEASDWKVGGANGAAALLGMKPTTLSSRMKALGVARPR